MIHKHQTSPNRDCPFSPGARGTQTTGIKVTLATFRVYVFRVLRVKCGLGQGAGGRWWWKGASSDLDAKGDCLDPPAPRKERDFADMPLETWQVFLQV